MPDIFLDLDVGARPRAALDAVMLALSSRARLTVYDLEFFRLVMSIAEERGLTVDVSQVDGAGVRILSPEEISRMLVTSTTSLPHAVAADVTTLNASADDDDENEDRSAAIAAAETAVLIAADELAETIACDQATALHLLAKRLRADGHIP